MKRVIQITPISANLNMCIDDARRLLVIGKTTSLQLESQPLIRQTASASLVELINGVANGARKQRELTQCN